MELSQWEVQKWVIVVERILPRLIANVKICYNSAQHESCSTMKKPIQLATSQSYDWVGSSRDGNGLSLPNNWHSRNIYPVLVKFRYPEFINFASLSNRNLAEEQLDVTSRHVPCVRSRLQTGQFDRLQRDRFAYYFLLTFNRYSREQVSDMKLVKRHLSRDPHWNYRRPLIINYPTHHHRSVVHLTRL